MIDVVHVADCMHVLMLLYVLPLLLIIIVGVCCKHVIACVLMMQFSSLWIIIMASVYICDINLYVVFVCACMHN